MDKKPEMITVLIEYVPTRNAVVVRTAWRGDGKKVEPLSPGNQQNYVKVFEGLTSKAPVGFTIPEK